MERSAASAATIEQRSPAAYVAEFIGTFVLVFSITLAVSLFINPQGTGSDWAVVGLVHFLVLFMIVMTIGSISGAHVNPAVTLALLALRKIRPNDAAVYILVQLAGAVAGALMTKFLLIDELADQQNVGAPSLNLSILGGDFQGFIASWSGRSSSCGRSSRWRSTRARRATGPGSRSAARLGFAVLILGPLTGAALNPARWFGPALVSGEWNTPLLYIFAPIVGGVLAALTYWYLFVEGPPVRAATPEAGPKGLRQDVNPPR